MRVRVPPTLPTKDETMNSEDTKTLEDMIRDNIIDDPTLWDLFDLDKAVSDDDEFEQMMYIISETIGEWSNRLANRSSEE